MEDMQNKADQMIEEERLLHEATLAEVGVEGAFRPCTVPSHAAMCTRS